MRAVAIFFVSAATVVAAPKSTPKPPPKPRPAPTFVISPADAQPLVKSAIALMQKDDLTGAKKALDEALKATPTDAVVLLNLGIVE